MTGPLDTAISASAGQIRELAARVTMLERNQRSGYNPRNTVIEGGSLTVNGPDGTPAVVVGAQPDGTFTARQVATVVPPGAPSTPLVSPGINGLYVSWDGYMASGITPPYDFAAVQVHVSQVSGFTPDSTTLQGHMVGAGLFGVGGLSPGTTYYVALVAINGVGDSGPGSAQSSGVPVAVPAGAIPAGSITALQIQTGTITAAQIATAAGILGSQIASGTITSANILAGTITTALLAAGIVVAGIVDATVITGSTLRNSTADPKTSINPDGSITITNSGGTVIFRIDATGTIFWYSGGGTLMMELQPGGTQLIYASLTGPSGWNFEPPSAPSVIVQGSATTSATTYSQAVVIPVTRGSAVTVAASSSGSDTATGVTDSQGNTYTLVQSCTAGVFMQVFQAANVNPLSTTDTITVTYGSATANIKNFLGLATGGVLTASVTDYSAKATGTSAAPSATGTPASYGDAEIFIVASASGGGPPSTVTDGWTQQIQQQASTGHYTTVWYSANVTGLAQTATTAITSAGWSAVILGLKASPATPASVYGIFGNNSNLSPSTAWANDGVLSMKITHNNTTTGWGATFPAFTVQPGSTVSMQAQVFTPTALSAVSAGFTFWSGAGGTGTNLGTVSGDQGTLSTTAGSVYAVSITGAAVPAGAVSATFSILENAADAVNTVFYVDTIQVPGGLVYSNSPTGGVDSLGNPYEQGINFIGLPGLTNVLGVQSPYGTQLANIDGSGNITGQTISAVSDIYIGGQSISSGLAGGALGVINQGTIGMPFPSTGSFGTTETAFWELDAPVSAGRAYRVIVGPGIVQTNTANVRVILDMFYTLDGTTPTTSSAVAAGSASQVSTSGAFAPSPTLVATFNPTSDGTLRVLIAGYCTTGTFNFQNRNITMTIEDMGEVQPGAGTSNVVLLGSGSSGSSGGTVQNYTEYFYPANTWSFNEYGLRDKNGTMYQGAYQGEGYAQHAWIQWAAGSLGHGLNTVLNYTVSKVSLRLTNLHSWYNNGMTVSFHSANGSAPNQSLTGASVELQNWFISQGNTWDEVLTSAAWSPFKAAGTTYTVLHPPGGSLSLSYYGYFYGPGGVLGNNPRLTVQYSH